MKDIIIPGDYEAQTPMIEFKANGELKLEGKSFPENPLRFYEPLIAWIRDLKDLHLENVTLTVKLDYFNTSSSKLILYMFRELEKLHFSRASKVKIIWLYLKTDEDMKESGKDYKSMISVPFVLLESTPAS